MVPVQSPISFVERYPQIKHARIAANPHRLWLPRALTMEVDAARSRVTSFRSAVGSLAQKMLHSFPLPAVASPESTTKGILFAGGPRARIESWQTANGDRVQRTSVAGRTLSWLVVRSSGAAYERVDVLGDGSFAELHVNPRTVHVP